LTEEFADTTG